jgi:hypothetical protein
MANIMNAQNNASTTAINIMDMMTSVTPPTSYKPIYYGFIFMKIIRSTGRTVKGMAVKLPIS